MMIMMTLFDEDEHEDGGKKGLFLPSDRNTVYYCYVLFFFFTPGGSCFTKRDS